MNKEYQENLLEFWMKLLPDINSSNKLNCYIKEYWNCTLDEVLEEISKIKAGEILGAETDYSYDQEKEYNKTFDKISTKYMWSEFLRVILKKEAIALREIIYESAIVFNKEILFENLFEAMIQGCYSISLRVLYQEYIKSCENEISKEKNNKIACFNKRLFDTNYIYKIYNSYPELARIVQLNAENFTNFLSEIIKETEINIDGIRQEINNNINMVENIEVSMGDSHRGGKCVCILNFNNGIKIVYKPRKLESEVAFFDLVDYINKQNIKDYLELKTFKYYTCKNHGWVEYVNYKECETEQQIKNFYIRMGELLGLLYILNAKDFHSENIICSGEYPVLIDLETLLHGISFESGIKLGGACDEALNIVNNSVMKTGLLPMKIINPKNGRQINIGAMGSEGEQVSPFPSFAIEEDKEGNIILKEYYSILSYKNNVPQINKKVKKAVDYIDDLINGFEIIYDYICIYKNEFIKEIGNFFTDIKKNRIIIRSTNVYDQLLKVSYHPDLLTDVWSRKIFLLKLLEVTDINISVDICRAELLDMYNGDIPFFTYNINFDEMFDSKEKAINNFPKIEMMRQVIDKINNLNKNDKKRQIGFIRVSFLEEMENNNISDENVLLNIYQTNKKEEANYDEIIDRLIDIILRQRITTVNDNVNKHVWLEVNRTPGWPTFISYTKPDLYSGLIGIYLVLNLCASISKREDVRCISNDIKKAILHNYKDIIISDKPILGAFTGVFGIMYMLCKDADCHNSLELLIWSIRNINVDDFSDGDIMGGGAGIIKVLLLAKKVLRKYEKKYDVEIDAINRINDKVVNYIKETAIKEKQYIFWGEEGYVGYAHGTAGIIDSLTDFYRDTHDESVLYYIQKGYEYICQNFSVIENNWMKDKYKNVYSKGWCHGAPGILLLQLNLLKTFNNDFINVSDIRKTFNIVIDNGFDEDYCLCHGDMGNLIILNKVAHYLGDEQLKRIVKKQLKKTISNLNEKIYGDYFYYKENWSLMLGVTSILAGILDIEYQKDLSSILTLT